MNTDVDNLPEHPARKKGRALMIGIGLIVMMSVAYALTHPFTTVSPADIAWQSPERILFFGEEAGASTTQYIYRVSDEVLQPIVGSWTRSFLSPEQIVLVRTPLDPKRDNVYIASSRRVLIPIVTTTREIIALHESSNTNYVTFETEQDGNRAYCFVQKSEREVESLCQDVVSIIGEPSPSSTIHTWWSDIEPQRLIIDVQAEDGTTEQLYTFDPWEDEPTSIPAEGFALTKAKHAPKVYPTEPRRASFTEHGPLVRVTIEVHGQPSPEQYMFVKPRGATLHWADEYVLLAISPEAAWAYNVLDKTAAQLAIPDTFSTVATRFGEITL